MDLSMKQPGKLAVFFLNNFFGSRSHLLSLQSYANKLYNYCADMNRVDFPKLQTEPTAQYRHHQAFMTQCGLCSRRGSVFVSQLVSYSSCVLLSLNKYADDKRAVA